MTHEMTSDEAMVAAMVEDKVYGAISDSVLKSERTKLSMDHFIGVSDVGGCREYVRRVILQQPFTDEKVEILQSWVGTAIGDLLERLLAKQGVQVQTKIEARLPSGTTHRGTADLVFTEEPAGVVDCKTVEGLGRTRHAGPSDQQWFQVTIYALGLIQAGVLTEDCYVTLVYIDRAGRDEKPIAFTEKFSWDRVKQADDWMTDVLYAIQTGEEASKDKPRNWCWACCPYATDCRSDDTSVEGLIEDPEILTTLAIYQEAKAREKESKALAKSAMSTLRYVEGSTGKFTVKPVPIAGGAVSYYREPYLRLDVRPVKGS